LGYSIGHFLEEKKYFSAKIALQILDDYGQFSAEIFLIIALAPGHFSREKTPA
jgi:hypothetical protein